ncbi:conjugal transfer protein TraN [Pectobacterium versatile]|uniref:conjugal transfer protein TraN n=1 Tax=Pectobacterium versatile TaxID=2488639 RepID=UPI001F38D049|nr:conjugal transfer protein TraN [Pectobacterium versatile]
MKTIITRLISLFLIIAQIIIPLSPLYIPIASADTGNYVCGQDLNNNDYIGDEGEYASCQSAAGSGTNYLCPIGKTSCNVDTTVSIVEPVIGCKTGTLTNGMCVGSNDWKEYYQDRHSFFYQEIGSYSSIEDVCAKVEIDGVSYINTCYGDAMRWSYPEYQNYTKEFKLYRYISENYDNDYNFISYNVDVNDYVIGKIARYVYTRQWYEGTYEYYSLYVKKSDTLPVSTCPTGYTMLGDNKCHIDTPKYTCPVSSNNACVNDGTGYYCSPNTCVNLSDNPAIDEGNIDGTTLVDDGKKDESGVCLDQVYIFNGRAQTCLPPGLSTGFQNCCANKGSALQDSAGTITSMASTMSTISDVYTAAKEAYETYVFFAEAGAAVAESSAFAAAAFTDALMASFNPATIAIGIAIKLVMDYLLQACPQESIETAMFRDSGYCHSIGTYCKKKIPLIGCVQKANAYCCFNSKLARIIHEQGRPQLNTFDTWGDPKSPVCRGFTPEEFQSVDFAQIDLTEYIEDLTKNATDNINSQISDTIKDFYDKTN